eukprot:g4320.t1
MMIRSLVGFAGLISRVEGHSLQQVPVSRQYSQTRDFHDASYEHIEYRPFAYAAGGVVSVIERAKSLTDPAVLAEYGGGDKFPLYYSDLAENGNYLEPEAIAVRHGACGDPRLSIGGNNYSTPNSDWPVLSEYESGQVIEMEILIAYYHWGHFEFFICDVNDLNDPDGVVTQECLNKHPLTRSPDTGSGSPIDPNYSGRYYVDPPCRQEEEVEQNVSENFVGEEFDAHTIKMRYVLPEIVCDHCVLQMHYLTGHRCWHIGYDEFDPPSWNSECAPNTTDWINMDNGLCGLEDYYAEEFWGCSDIRIVAASSSPTQSPTASPTAALNTAYPSAAPTTVYVSSSSPTATPTATPTAFATPPSSSDAVRAIIGDLGNTPAPAVSSGSPTATPTTFGFGTSTADSIEGVGDLGDTPAPAIGAVLSDSGAPPVGTIFSAFWIGLGTLVGHFELFVCDVNDLDDPYGVVTQECFNKHPLNRAPYTGSGSPIDPSYPGRYYMDPPCRRDAVEQNTSGNFVSDSYDAYSVKMPYVWPDIKCEHGVLQMHYLTGNRCKHIGYDEFDPPSWDRECAPNTTDWTPTDIGLCGGGLSYAEEFWACSDIKLSA